MASLLQAVFAPKHGPAPVLVHQDSHFIPKNLCPRTEFDTVPSDVGFVSLLLSSGELGAYYLKVNHSSSAPGSYTFSGPDADCDGALNFDTLYHHVLDVINCTSESGQCEGTFCCGVESGERDGGFGGGFVGTFLTPDFEALGLGPLAKELREKVTKALAGYDYENLKLAIVEGFLLFQDPELLGDTTPNSNAPPTPLEMGQVSQALEEISATSANTGKVDMKAALQSLMDIKLFLPVDHATAVERRFSRPEYKNLGDGDAGNLWKTRGYFDAVAWKNYMSSYGWLIGHGMGGDDRRSSGWNGMGEVIKGINVGVENGTVRSLAPTSTPAGTPR